MRGRNGRRIAVLLLCMGLCCSWVAVLRHATLGPAKAVDFDGVYYGAQCALEGLDPYLYAGMCGTEADAFLAKTKNLEHAAPRSHWEVYLPPALVIVAPLALLPLPVAEVLWIFLTAVALVLAALLVWDMEDDAPVVSGCLAAFVLLNCVMLLDSGNPAGLVVPLSVVAAWCFLERHCEAVGVVLLAVSLMIKPQIAGFVWLYFMLAGGTGRKRALQTLAVVIVLGVCTAFWIAPSSPHWTTELPDHIAMLAGHGALNDPGPSGMTYRGIDQIVSLQGAISLLKNDPSFYNPATYLLIGGLVAVWIFAVLRKRPTCESALLALAAVSFLALLPVYHRTHDAKLLLLAIPACAMLWSRGGARRWFALGLTSAAILVTSDIPLLFFSAASETLPVSNASFTGRLTLLLSHPAPLVLLATGCFYLWAYIRYKPVMNVAERVGVIGRAAEAAVG